MAFAELAFGILITPFFMSLLVSAVHISLALTWALVTVAERVMIKVGWIEDRGKHDRLRLSMKEKFIFADLMEHYDEEAQR